MYLVIILLTLCVIFGIITYKSYRDYTLSYKIGGFFQGFFTTFFVGGIISLLASLVINLCILDERSSRNRGGTLLSTYNNQLIKTEDSFAFINRDKLSCVYSTGKEPTQFKEYLFALKLIPLKEGEVNPYIVRLLYSSDSHWTLFDSETYRYDVHINQDQIKMIYDKEEKVEK